MTSSADHDGAGRAASHPARREDVAFEPFDLLRYFTGSALAIVLVASLAIGSVAAWLIHGTFLQMEKDEADSLAEDLVNLLVTSGYPPPRWGASGAGAPLRGDVGRVMENFDITEFTLYTLDGRMLEDFSPRSPGPRAFWRDGFESARAGEAALRWEAGRQGPLRWFRGGKTGSIESYVSVRLGGRISAVARVRRNLSPDVVLAQRRVPLIVGLAALLGIGVFGALWVMVRAADRILKRQHLELRGAQLEIERRNRLLEELSRRKDEFYAMCGHDLRAPIVATQAGCRFLLDAADDLSAEERRDVLEENLRNTTIVLDLLSNLLELARIEERGEELDAVDLDLRDVVGGLVAANRALAASRAVLLTAELPPEEVRVRADRLKLLRILNNLISNAIRHAAGGPVTVRLGRSPEGARIAVADHGPGIRPEIRTVLFRANGEPAGIAGDGGDCSHGLGLSIVRRLVEMHGGSVQVSTSLGEGSTFVVTLPGA